MQQVCVDTSCGVEWTKHWLQTKEFKLYLQTRHLITTGSLHGAFNTEQHLKTG